MSEAAAGTGVRIRLAGVFRVERDGARLDDRAIRGKSRTLLGLLAAERGRVVPIHRIEDVLWAGSPPKRPVSNVATLVSRLRRLLGPRVILGGRVGYRLGAPPTVSVDVDEAAALTAESEGRLAADEPAVAGAAAARALDLLGGGTALEGEPRAEWAEATSLEVADLLRRARHAAATAAVLGAEPEVARRAAGAAVAADPFDETAHRLLMKAHAAAGEPARALQVYERLRGALADELGADPAPETRNLHVAILQGRPRHPQPQPSTPRLSVPAAPAPIAPAGGVFVAAGDGALVGREGEMVRIARAWSEAREGRPVVLVVAGEAGIGKSRLAAEAARHAASTGGTVLQAACHETERSLFLQPFADALAPHIAGLAPSVLGEAVGVHASALGLLVPDAARALGTSGGLDLGEFGRNRVYQAVAAFLRGAGARAPVLLMLDDLHNAGEPTVGLVAYLARRAAWSRLLCVATVRLEEGEDVLPALDGVARRIDLGPLAPAAVTALAAAAGKDGPADRVFRRTRGHTRSVVEILRGPGDESVVPDAVRRDVLRRMRRAGEPADRLLRAAAVLGEAFDPVDLAALVDLPPHEVARHCERALAARLLVVSGHRYEFASELTRQAVHATTPEPTRRVHERRASDVLGGPTGPTRSRISLPCPL
ncbi:AAA family ATPase [Actinomadura graeca]|uniref:AAA family ATPase n=1 Tax=Actinomadura graeca TaxID=2750812 RepID=A0ABX8QTH3_9ACTN|nr:AAA family ATPase [Actinomadura graeca]QXJ21484.1 AAA family ATPase [Actinomadura graeca]